MGETDIKPPERSRDAWSAFCADLEAAGDGILEAGSDLGPADVAEGYRHLSRLTRLALELMVEYGDPAYPRFVNHERPTIQWGGPNPDNYYLRAPIDPGSSYRVWGDVTGVEDVIFSLAEGDMALDRYGVYSETTLAELDVTEGRLELALTTDEQAGNWMPMHPDASILMIRVYQSDPSSQPAPYFHIERLDADWVAPPRLDADGLEAGLRAASEWLTASARYWPQFMTGFAASAEPNVLSPPTQPPGGADNILYGACLWQLEDGEALVIDSAVPDAEYWNFTIHTYPWFESGDHERRQTSLNHRTAHVDPDGRVRMVLAHTDPGVPNWIDTEGRRSSMLTYRWIQSRDAPQPVAHRTRLSDLGEHLPGGHPTTTAEERRSALARRAEGQRERFR